MKLMLCVRSIKEIQGVIDHFHAEPKKDNIYPFLFRTLLFQHVTTVVETGAGVYQTAFKVGKALTGQRYHLALKVSFANAYKEKYPVGTVLNIVNDKPGDYGVNTHDGWKDFYELGWNNPQDRPHNRGGFINFTNSFMNTFLPYKKVVGVTVNNYADTVAYRQRLEKYKADCETIDGLGFTYPCMYEYQKLYHLCVIERNLATGEENLPLAQETLNQLLLHLLPKI